MNEANETRSEEDRNQAKLIFVVDDEQVLGEMSAYILQTGGYQTQFFSDPTLALAAIDGAKLIPHLLLTDYQMEPINGMELIDECRRLHPALKTILYSGKVEADITQRYSIKPDRFLKKPFHPRALLAMADALLANVA